MEFSFPTCLDNLPATTLCSSSDNLNQDMPGKEDRKPLLVHYVHSRATFIIP